MVMIEMRYSKFFKSNVNGQPLLVCANKVNSAFVAKFKQTLL